MTNMQFQPYQKYKPSGIDWLGEIPEGWEVKRLKDLFFQVSIKTSCIPESSYIPLENIESFTGILLQKVSNENNEETLLFKKNDILFNKLRPYLGKVLLADFDGGISTEAIVMRLIKKNKYQNRFFLYRFLSTNFIFKVNSITTGVKMPRTNPDRVLEISCPIPNKQTQTAIADYLDKHTALIDKKIELLKAKKQSYTQLKQTLINEVVTKGLDKTVEMKDSGIEWIGQIPKYWEVKRGKELFKENSKSKITANEGEKIGKYKFFTSSNEQSKWLDYFIMNSESILFSTGGSAGVNYCEKEYSYSTDTWSIYGNKKTFLKYFAYYFESILHEINSLGFRGAGLEHLQKDFINLGEIIFPPKPEQIAIANYLDEKTSKIDQIIKKIDENILALQEFRKTLINDTVTGKIKIL